MRLNILKLEDILFKNSQGERVFTENVIDTDEVSSIEGVSEHSVLQLEYKGETYLLTEEFVIDATPEDLDEFLEEYDEEDEENVDHAALYDPEIVAEDEEFIERLSDDDFRDYNYQNSELEKDIAGEEESYEVELSSEEAIKEEFKELKFLRQTNNEVSKNEADVIKIDKSIALEKSTEEEIWVVEKESLIEEESEIEEFEESTEESIEERVVEQQESNTLPSSSPLILHEVATLNTLIRMEKGGLELGDLGTLGITGFNDTAENIARLNNVLADTSNNEGRDTEQLQAIVDALVKVMAKSGNGLEKIQKFMAKETPNGTEDLTKEAE